MVSVGYALALLYLLPQVLWPLSQTVNHLEGLSSSVWINCIVKSLELTKLKSGTNHKDKIDILVPV